MSPALPLVSIGMPAYNGSTTIAEALASLLSQDYENLELIISDDGSQDGTFDICSRFAASDSRVRLVRHSQNCGAYANFNDVFRLAGGDYFMWSAQDDRWHPHFVRRCVEQLTHNSDAVLCYSEMQPIAPDGTSLGDPLTDLAADDADVVARWRRVLEDWRLNACVYGMMRRDVAARTKLLRIRLAADVVFVAQMALFGRVLHVPEVLHFKRRPVRLSDYRSWREMLDYVGGAGQRVPRMLRRQVMRELVLAVDASPHSPRIKKRLARTCWQVYFRRGYWHHDLKEVLRSLIGPSRYDRVVGPIKRFKQLGAWS